MVNSLLENLLPDRIQFSERFLLISDCQLHKVERQYIENAVPQRKSEFNTGRVCAREALGELNYEDISIPADQHRRPIWPNGVVGSITHCLGFCAAAVALKKHYSALGIDAEPHQDLPEGVFELTSSTRERDWISQASSLLCWGRVLFSCKEAVFKAANADEYKWLDFEDIEIYFENETGSFTAQINVNDYNQVGNWQQLIIGKWIVIDNYVLSCAYSAQRKF